MTAGSAASVKRADSRSPNGLDGVATTEQKPSPLLVGAVSPGGGLDEPGLVRSLVSIGAQSEDLEDGFGKCWSSHRGLLCGVTHQL